MKKLCWSLVLLGFLWFLFFMPREIMHSDYKIVDVFIFGLIFALLPYLVWKTLECFDNLAKYQFIMSISSILIVAKPFGMFHIYRDTEELKKAGVWTKAVVVESRYISSEYTSGWIIQCSYDVEGKKYRTKSMDDEENNYSIGDTIDLIYIKDFPKICRAGHNWKER